jgi:hypothetical protein
MAYGHAEPVLDAIRLLEAETVALLFALPHLGGEEAGWLKVASGRCDLLGYDVTADINQAGGYSDGDH